MCTGLSLMCPQALRVQKITEIVKEDKKRGDQHPAYAGPLLHNPLREKEGHTHTHTHTHTHKKQWRNVGYPPAEGRVENSQGMAASNTRSSSAWQNNTGGREREPEEEREEKHHHTHHHQRDLHQAGRFSYLFMYLLWYGLKLWPLFIFWSFVTVMAKLNFQQPLFQCHIKSF